MAQNRSRKKVNIKHCILVTMLTRKAQLLSHAPFQARVIKP